MKIDNIQLDESNAEFNYAAELAENTNKMLYLTGKAGSGKTTFLKYIKQSTAKKSIVLAPTGVAALNAGGQTIHSFFRIPPSVFVPADYRLRSKPHPNSDDKSTIFDNFKYQRNHKKLINELELLIIDEISMVRCDLLDVVDRILRVFRDKENLPFGGVQVILIGDAFQLPPIARNEHWELLSQFYDTPFFFSSNIMKEIEYEYIELQKIYRQSDEIFIDLLNKVRTNQVSTADLELLNSRFLPSVFKNDNLNYITIATHNRIVDETNQRKLADLNSKPFTYAASVIGDFPDMMMPTEAALTLKEGAQVMFIKNDVEKRFFNGKIGIIKKLDEDMLTVGFSDGGTIEVYPHTWSNIKYSWNSNIQKIDEETVGEFTQFPLKLAWAVTVHKCQGLTFEHAIADLSASFSPGQVYVALSRCTSLNGLVLKSRINRHVIKTDPRVIDFSKRGNVTKKSLF